MALAHRGAHLTARAGVAQRADVGGIVEARELGLGRPRARVILAGAVPVERPAQVDHRFHARNRERMQGAIRGGAIDVVPHEHRAAAGAACLSSLPRSIAQASSLNISPV